MAAGRNRPWDLGKKQDVLQVWAQRAGMVLADSETIQFCDAAGPLRSELVPIWVRDCGDWSLACRLPGAAVAPLPSAATRFIWQAAPQLMWIPELECQSGDHWYIDHFLQAGRSLEPPAPASTVPRWALAGLKKIFDPWGQLAVPPWLAAAGVAGTEAGGGHGD